MAQEMEEWEVWAWMEYFAWKGEQEEKAREKARAEAKRGSSGSGDAAPPRTMGPKRDKFVKADAHGNPVRT